MINVKKQGFQTHISEEKEGEKVDESVRQLLVLLAGSPDLIEEKELISLSCFLVKDKLTCFHPIVR